MTPVTTAEQLTCEACDRTADADDEFRAYVFGEVDDQICDECLAVQADTAQWDAFDRAAYYHH
jgi:uncharacterized protein CbrC (UPF0167 family)